MASPVRPRRPPAAPRTARRSEALNPDLAGAICEAFSPVDPGPEARNALRSRLLRRVHATPDAAVAPPAPADHVVIRAHDSGWVDLAPGIHAKLLYTDGRAESYLARLDAGVVIPPHVHPGVEECVVLEGRVEFSDGSFLQAGDYQAQFASSHHAAMSVPHGALLFLRYAEPLGNYLAL